MSTIMVKKKKTMYLSRGHHSDWSCARWHQERVPGEDFGKVHSLSAVALRWEFVKLFSTCERLPFTKARAFNARFLEKMKKPITTTLDIMLRVSFSRPSCDVNSVELCNSQKDLKM